LLSQTNEILSLMLCSLFRRGIQTHNQIVILIYMQAVLPSSEDLIKVKQDPLCDLNFWVKNVKQHKYKFIFCKHL
jgi:hypothetical protein